MECISQKLRSPLDRDLIKKRNIFNKSGAPNENIVKNHLNIALLNVFQYLNGRYRHIFIIP